MKDPVVPKYLQQLIDEREGLHLDFKFEISGFRKIARSLVAFANTDGGKLLIGVKDNGKIAGIRTDEELYMVQAAANMYCRPKVDFYFRPWQVEKKTVLEVTIPKSSKRPHYAHDEKDRWRAYIRVKDKNFVANKVQLRVWQSENQPERKPVNIRFERKEDVLLKYLREHEYITFGKFCKIARLPANIAEDVLVDLILIGVLKIEYTDEGIARYVLVDNPEAGGIFNGII